MCLGQIFICSHEGSTYLYRNGSLLQYLHLIDLCHSFLKYSIFLKENENTGVDISVTMVTFSSPHRQAEFQRKGAIHGLVSERLFSNNYSTLISIKGFFRKFSQMQSHCYRCLYRRLTGISFMSSGLCLDKNFLFKV